MKASERTPRRARELVSVPEDAARVARRVMHDEQETFVVLCLDVRNGLIVEPLVVALGTATSVEVYPRDVFREAVRRNAAAVVVAHNHPSGDPTPSDEDVALTRRLATAGAVLGIPVVDHIVVAPDGFRSIREVHGADVFRA